MYVDADVPEEMTLSVAAEASELYPEETIRPRVVTFPQTASAYSIAWESSAPEVASVQGGVVTAHSAGTATITASCGGKTASVDIEVFVSATDFTIPSEIWVVAKQSCEEAIIVVPSDAQTEFAFAYSSDAITAGVTEGVLGIAASISETLS